MMILALLYLILPVFQAGLYLSGQMAFDAWSTIDSTLSILAVHWLLSHVILGAKVPLLQRMLPYDQRIRFHILGSLGIFVAVAYHASFKLLMGSHISPVTWALLVVLASTLLLAVLWIPVPGFKALRARTSARLHKNAGPSYDKSKWLHGWLILGLGGLLFLHLLDSGIFDELPFPSTLAYWTLFGLAAVLLVTARLGAFRTKATVVSAEEQAGLLVLAVEPDRRIRYRAGQFAFLRTRNARGRLEEHPFSFLSQEDDAHGLVRFGIRMNGDFTNFLKELKSGDRLEISHGFGNFRPRKSKAICLVGSGVGTVPIISLLKDLHAKGDQRPIKAFLAVNQTEELLDHDLLVNLETRMPNLEVHRLVYLKDGQRFSTEVFRYALPDPKAWTWYLCSSPVVRKAVLGSLDELGVKRRDVHYEEFAFA